MPQSYPYTSAVELLGMIRSRQASPVEIMQQCLARMDGLEPRINAFVTRTPELAMEAARRAEKAVMDGGELGALHGLPVSVKDLIAVGYVRLTFGSRTAAENVADADAPSVERLKAAGACIIGKTTTSEFGCKAVGDSPLTGITRNPWNTAKTPGGSSCGAAASIATGVSPFGLGTDGGGSIRGPSAFTGLFGIKPQFARVPVFPAAAAPTVSHVGPMARTVRDAALLLTAIAGFDARDPFSVAEAMPDFLGACERPVKGLKVAWSPTLGYAKPAREIVAITEQAVSVFESLGCRVEQVDRVMDADPADLWTSEFYAGIGTRLKKQYRDSPELLDPALRDVLERALSQTFDAYYGNVVTRYAFRESIRRFFERYDLLMTPQTPLAAFDVGIDVPPELPDCNMVSWLYYTYPFNLTGQPAASVPVGFTVDNLPVGLQIVAKTNREVDIFSAAAAFEQARPWAQHRPPQFN